MKSVFDNRPNFVFVFNDLQTNVPLHAGTDLAVISLQRTTWLNFYLMPDLVSVACMILFDNVWCMDESRTKYEQNGFLVYG